MAQVAKPAYLFKNHTEGYNMYRIPTIIATPGGKLLAFCEGRNNLMDGGNIDLVMKTSTDGGNTWSGLKVVWDSLKNTCGNPTPVIDKTTGNILLLATLNNDRVVIFRSADEGATWVKNDITTQVKPANWQWYATGPVHAIQMENPTYKNRLVVPCNHTIKGAGAHISHIIYSDDGGINWAIGGSSIANTDECTVVELSNGALLLNMRNKDRVLPNRKIATSTDGGFTWSEARFDSTLIEPICQGALLKHANQLLFTNPAHKKKRQNLTLYTSGNNGQTWQPFAVIRKGKSAYSDMATLPNGNVLCVFEMGKLWPYGGVAYTVITFDLQK